MSNASIDHSSFCVTSLWKSLRWFASGLASIFFNLSLLRNQKLYTSSIFQSRIFLFFLLFIFVQNLSSFQTRSLRRKLFDLLTNGFNVFSSKYSVEEEWIFKTWILSCWTRWAWESRRKSSSGISRFIIVAFRLIPMCVRNCNESKMRTKQSFTIKNNKSISLLTVIYLFLYRG